MDKLTLTKTAGYLSYLNKSYDTAMNDDNRMEALLIDHHRKVFKLWFDDETATLEKRKEAAPCQN